MEPRFFISVYVVFLPIQRTAINPVSVLFAKAIAVHYSHCCRVWEAFFSSHSRQEQADMTSSIATSPLKIWLDHGRGRTKSQHQLHWHSSNFQPGRMKLCGTELAKKSHRENMKTNMFHRMRSCREKLERASVQGIPIEIAIVLCFIICLYKY